MVFFRSFDQTYLRLSIKNPPEPQAGSIILLEESGSIMLVRSLTTFLGVKNCPCPPLNDGEMKVSKASPTTSLFESTKQNCCSCPTT